MAVIHKNVIHKALTDPKFGKEVFTKLPLSAFEEGTQRELIQIIKRYYINQSKPLDQDTLLTLTESYIENKNLKDSELDELFRLVNNAYEVSSDANQEVISTSVNKFVRKALSIDVLQETLSKGDIAEEGTIEELSEKLREISVIDVKGQRDGTSIDFFEDYDTRVDLYNNMKRDTNSTGYENIDEILEGNGLAKGELSLLISPSGYGKSTFMIQTLNNAIKQGKNALYVTLEERAEKINSRIETNLIDKSLDYFIDMFGNLNIDKYAQVQKFYETKKDIWGKIFIERRNPYETTVEDIEQMIVDIKIRSGEDLDLVVIDYPEIMKKPSSSSRRDEDVMGELFHRLRGLAGKYEFVLWAVAQTNRTATTSDDAVVTSANIQGAFKIINSCELVLSMNRTPEEKKNNRFRLHVDKVRNPNPQALIPEMLYFQTDVQAGYNIRAETKEEILTHDRIIQSGKDNYDDTSHYENAMEHDKANDSLVFS